MWRRNSLIRINRRKSGQPRLKPPYPANVGLWGNQH